MAGQRYDEAIELFMKKFLRQVHTSVPCTVVGVDLSVPSVDLQPTVSTDFGDNYKPDVYPVLYDVPLLVYSANGGKAKMTVPVKAGDKAALHFSERNPHSKTDLSTHGMYSCYAVVGMEGEVHPEDIVIKNEIAEMSFSPDGTITLKNSSANIVAQPDGNVKVNGLTITPSGNLITAAGVDLELFYAHYLQHYHAHGEPNTSKPINP